MDVSPPEAYNALGVPHTFTFSCDNAASLLTVPPGAIPSTAAGLTPGCYDVHATVTDVTTGSETNIIAAQCASAGSPPLSSSIDCSMISNPICAAGYTPIGAGQCSPCPAGFTYSNVDALCHTSPIGGTCPPGTTPINNAAGSPVDCTEATIAPQASTVNQVTVTINPGAPHVYRVDFTGYVGTTTGGGCPAGTTLQTDVNYTPVLGIPSAGPGVTGPGCAFDVAAFKKYLEVTTLNILPEGTCTGTAPSELQSQLGGAPCLFRVVATGMVVLKTGVDCSQEPSGPVNPTPTSTTAGQEPPVEDAVDEYTEPNAAEVAEGVDEGPDRTGTPNETYVCTNGTLELTRGVPFAQIDLTAVNGIFPGPGVCVPAPLAPTVATPTPTGSPAPTSTPTATPAFPTPTNTPGPTPVPFTSSPVAPGFCQLNGQTSKVVTTDENGVAPLVPPELEAAAIPDSDNPASPSDCQFRPYVPGGVAGTHVFICGRLFAGDQPVANALMSTVFNIQPGNPPLACVPLQAPTDENGRAFCEHPDVYGTSPGGDQVAVDVYFNLSGDLEGNFCQTRTYFVRAPAPPPTATDPSVTYCPTDNLGIAVVPTGFSPVGVIATAASIINTQPAVSSGLVTLGQQTFGTPLPTLGPGTPVTPLPSLTPVLSPTPTNTPVPTATFTPTPTSTPVPTSTTVPSPTPIPPLSFTLDAARVSAPHPKNPEKRPGMDMVRPGQKVWLMMFYTLKSVPKKVTRVTTYQLFMGTRSVFRASFKGPESAGTTGTFIRYTTVTFPTNAAAGVYNFQATLQLGGKKQSRNWRFAVLKGVVRLTLTRDVVLSEASASAANPAAVQAPCPPVCSRP